MRINRQILLTSIVLLLTIIFFGISDVDTFVQDYFYNTTTKSWILSSQLEPYKFIFYDGIKKLLILIALSLLIALVFFRKTKLIQEYKKGLLVVVLDLIVNMDA